MPSRFPGMDVWIESQRWEQFHFEFIGEAARQLVPLVRPRYEVAPEQRIYVERSFGQDDGPMRADFAVLEHDETEQRKRSLAETATAVAAPASYTLPMPEERREAFLVIRDRRDMSVVTIIELLSPSNKAPRSDGREAYLRKRLSIFESQTNLVEIDLLRGGLRLPTMERLQSADYFVFICRGAKRPQADVYAWHLRQPLPAVPIPLAADDDEVTLDLQAVFDRVYDDFGYDYALDYRQPAQPPLSEADAKWAEAILLGT
jgi:hypothetical protein